MCNLESGAYDFPIDIVYLWCDGNDPALFAKRLRFLDDSQKAEVSDGSATAKGRFEDNDELKYALRSLERFASFVRKVFVVTDGQCPRWLRLDHPKIQLVDHKEIIPEEFLPTFNSNVIEAFVHNIPGLSECFLLANDDCFFGAEVGPDLFFDKKGNPVVYGKPSRFIRSLPKRGDSCLDQLLGKQFQYNYCYANLLVFKRFGCHFPFSAHHNIDSYRKGLVSEVVSTFSDEYIELYPSRFRRLRNVNRFLPLFYGVAKGRATVRIVDNFSKSKMIFLPKIITLNFFRYHSLVIPLDSLFCKGSKFSEVLREKIKRGHFNLLCFNDTENVEDEHREYFRGFISEVFPDKSSYEI